VEFRAGSILELPRDADIIQCFDRPVKTSCGDVNMAKKAENAQANFFIILNYKTFPI